MDPLSITVDAITLAAAALQSAKVLYGIVNRLSHAPQAVLQSKQLVSQTQTTLTNLMRTLERDAASSVLDSVLKEMELSKALDSTNVLCQDFTAAITKFTGHSTDSQFSKRDRLVVYFNEAKIDRLNRDLADCQRTISMALSSIILIVSGDVSGKIDQLRSQFDAQERALADLATELGKRESRPVDDETATERDSSVQLTATLQEVCQKTMSATHTRRTDQKFGDMLTDDHSIAMQGIVGAAQQGVGQTFGSLTTTKASRAFQGQIDANSFDKLFGQ